MLDYYYFALPSGNEDNVELYVNHTGLMWENAAEFGAGWHLESYKNK